jgi:hypothetical protein
MDYGGDVLIAQKLDAVTVLLNDDKVMTTVAQSLCCMVPDAAATDNNDLKIFAHE